MTSVLRREAFKTSRLAEFCSTRELTNQTGHSPDEWPLVILKELVDNAIDAAEEANVSPSVDIVVDGVGVTVADNGPGLAPGTVAAMLDYSSRVSSREAYVSPTRGAQGNAMKTILAMAFVLDGERGETIIESLGVRHRVVFTTDRIRQEPRIEHVQEPSLVKTGTLVTVLWPVCARSMLDAAAGRFLQIADRYRWTNPHLALSLKWGDDTKIMAAATTPNWRKWSPSDPTSPHWYDVERLGRLIGAKIAHAEDNNRACPTVREFVAEFRGLAGTAKGRDICNSLSASRQTLAEFYGAGDTVRVAALLAAMNDNSRAIRPRDLGEIGKDNIAVMMAECGAETDTVAYKRVDLELDGVPYLIEAAFGYCPERDERSMLTGLNWSVSIGSNPFRNVGFFGLDAILAAQHAGGDEPIVFFLHLVCPHLQFTDRGKSAVALPRTVSDNVAELVKTVTAKWAKQRKAEERDHAARMRRNDAMMRTRSISIKEAAARVLPAAYAKASSNNTLPANSRQIYYAARPAILALTGNETLDSKYFCQTVMVDYIDEHGLDWDVVWDDRGHFLEPHTGHTLGLGTLAVRDYLKSIHNATTSPARFAAPSMRTRGPHGRYSAILFIEKEGFLPLLQKVKLAERYDLAIMSSKGMSVTAARMLADRVCAPHDIPLLTLHDFDRAGFSIGETVGSSNRRYQFQNSIRVINLGLRLEDALRMGLEFEPAPIGNTDPDTIRERLRINGADEKEIATLVDEQLRCELNAMTSDQFVAFIEGRLDEIGIRKTIPGADEIADAYRMFRRGEIAREIVEKALADHIQDEIPVPDDLEDQLRAILNEEPDMPWDAAVAAIVGGRS